jgi:cytoskeletal protein RodZ
VDVDHFGSFLKQRREARGMTLADLSRATKIKESSLELLEAGRVDALPAPVFVRGFVTAVAREVGVDVDEALRRLRQSQVTAELPPVASVEPARPPVEEPLFDRRRVGVALVVFLFLIVATLTLSLLLRHTSAGGGLS